MTARRRLDQLARVAPCSYCHGSNPRQVAAEHRDGSPLDSLNAALDEIHRRVVACARMVPPAARTAREWASIEADRPSSPLVVSVLDELAATGDRALVDACRAYLAAVS